MQATGQDNSYRDDGMDRRQQLFEIGERVRTAVQDAVDTGDFGQISEVVKDTAGIALEEFRHQAGQVQERFETWNAENRTRVVQPEIQRAQIVKKLSKQYLNKRGQAGGVLCTIFGSIGLGIFGIITSFLLLGLLIAPDYSTAVITAFFALFALGFATLLKKGYTIQSRIKRARRYLDLMRGERYIKVQELAMFSGQTETKVQKDIKGMLRAGIFPQGHMDEKGRMFVLDDETWEQYLAVWKQWKEAQSTENEPAEETMCSEEKQMEREGRDWMDRLRQLNAGIPGEKISGKLYRLDALLQRVFGILKKHPEKCPQMQKFMDYYLPTTVKLLESYTDFERADIHGPQIETAKAEIEKTMDTINEAFEKLLEDLYQEEAFEASADARVLKTILAQDGYTKNNFFVQTEKEGESQTR